MRLRPIPCLLAALLTTSAAAARDPDLVSVGGGATDILNKQAFTAGDFRLEYRSGYSLIPFGEEYVKVKPWAGIEGTTRQSLWTGVGILLDIPIGQHFVLSPSFAPGFYTQGNGKRLGSNAEFRSQFEGGYVFDNQTRLVASFSHISNAGLTKRNPGTEAFVVSYQIPISAMVSGH